MNPAPILPGEIELGEQFGVSRTAVREASQNVNGKRDGFTATAIGKSGHATIELEFS